jgi:hypothetical protein
LSQAIAPTWSAAHTFSLALSGATGGIILASGTPGFQWNETDQATDGQLWRTYVAGGSLVWETINNALSLSKAWLQVNRTLNVITSVILGNATDNPTYTFVGTGLATMGGSLQVNGDHVGIANSDVYSEWRVTTNAADTKVWWARVNASGWQLQTRTDAFAAASQALVIQRTGTAVSSFNFGNATDNPTYTFLGTGNTVFGGRSYFPDGIAAVPSTSFTSDPDTGFNRLSANNFSALAGGVAVCTFFNSSGVTGVQIINGTLANPGLNFVADNNTGLFCNGVGDFRASCSGTLVCAFQPTALNMAVQILGTSASFSSTVTATSFTSTSSRAIKRETGRPSRVRDMLSRLRPLLYRLLDGDDREQLGLIAEEVHEVCPQLSDGKTVSYDRLAILLLAAWQDEHAEAA